MGNLLIYSAAANSCIWPPALPRCRHYRGSRGAAVLEVATLIAAAHHAVPSSKFGHVRFISNRVRNSAPQRSDAGCQSRPKAPQHGRVLTSNNCGA
jgi:hypothetical protein